MNLDDIKEGYARASNYKRTDEEFKHEGRETSEDFVKRGGKIKYKTSEWTVNCKACRAGCDELSWNRGGRITGFN